MLLILPDLDLVLSDLECFVGETDDIAGRHECVSSCVDADYFLLAGERGLVLLVGQLDLRVAVDLHQLVHHAQSWLRLARHQIRAYAKRIYLVVLLIELKQYLLVDIIARDYFKLAEIESVSLRSLRIQFPRLTRQ